MRTRSWATLALAALTIPILLAALPALPGDAPAAPTAGPRADEAGRTAAAASLQLPLLGEYALACPLASPLARCNTQLTLATGPANEVMVAANPRDPLDFLAVAKDYAHADPGTASCVGTAVYRTLDGGLTWTEARLQPAGAGACETDPVATYDAQGEPLVTTLRLEPRGVVAYRLDAAGAWAEVGQIPAKDKPWVGASAATGTLYLVDASPEFRRSTDGGLTWTTTATHLQGFAKQVASAPDGRVVVNALLQGGGMVSYVSLDDGLTFDGPFAVAEHRFPSFGLPTTLDILAGRVVRADPTFSLASDPSSGRFWAAFPGVLPESALPGPAAARLGTAQWDIWLTGSDDGITWDAPVRVNDDLGVAGQYFPAVAVTPDGVVHVAWMDQRADPTGTLVDVYYANVGAEGLLGNVRLTDQPFASQLSYQQAGHVSLGDYMGIAAADGRVVVTWPDTRHGRAEVFAAVLERIA